ncbi:hypothetical protein CPY51_30335 [Rhizobium tubonense]|uniref:Uncharacterized protein n=1 Tax=Rhizobium tubonense TaxID=484088 RepID=A0A2W4DVU5_9HYPH|nr:hypothetical protein CPY51_30335 [Rhizobium tubonense]
MSLCYAVASAIALSACATTEDKVATKEDRLAAAGFIIGPANTPKRVAMLKRAPANKFLKSVHGDSVTYIYADPVGCKCLYVGSQAAYDQYQFASQQAKVANRNLLAAEIYSDSSWNWGDWGPWRAGYNGLNGPGLGW